MNQSARSLLTLLAGCSQQAFLLQELLDKDRERVERKQALASLCQVLRLAQKKKRVRELHRKQALFQFRLVIKRVAEKKDALENEKLRAISRLVRAIQKGTDVKNAFDPWKATNRELTEGIWRTKDAAEKERLKKVLIQRFGTRGPSTSTRLQPEAWKAPNISPTDPDPYKATNEELTLLIVRTKDAKEKDRLKAILKERFGKVTAKVDTSYQTDRITRTASEAKQEESPSGFSLKRLFSKWFS